MCFASANNTADVFVYADDSVAPGALTVRKVSSTGFERSVVVGISPFVPDSSLTGYQWRSVIHFSVDIAYWPVGFVNPVVILDVLSSDGVSVGTVNVTLESKPLYLVVPVCVVYLNVGFGGFNPVYVYGMTSDYPVTVEKRSDDPVAFDFVQVRSSGFRWGFNYSSRYINYDYLGFFSVKGMVGFLPVPDVNSCVYLDVFLADGSNRLLGTVEVTFAYRDV
jgi:hypothetical protein